MFEYDQKMSNSFIITSKIIIILTTTNCYNDHLEYIYIYIRSWYKRKKEFVFMRLQIEYTFKSII